MPPTVALSLFWAFYMGGLGVFFPLFALYLRENVGLSGSEIGVVLATSPLIGAFAQPLVGQLADRSGARVRVLFSVTAGAAAGFAGMAVPQSVVGLVLASGLASLFITSVIPLGYSVTLELLRGAGPHAFGRVRAWGTVGFLVSVTGFPWLLRGIETRDWVSVSPRLGLVTAANHPALVTLFPLTALLAAAAALVAFRLPRTRSARALRAAPGEWRVLLHARPFRRAVLYAFLTFLCLQGPIHLFPMLVRARGGDVDDVSRLWVLMLSLEIPLVASMGRIAARVGPRGLQALALACAGARWSLCTWSRDPVSFAALQVLHGPTVAGLLGGPLYVEAAAPPRLAATAQTILSSVGTALGGVVSQLAAGWLYEVRGIEAPFVVAGIASLALALATPLLLPRLPARQAAPPDVPTA